MKEKQAAGDRHLDVPSEANRDKHVNFSDADQEGSENVSNDTSTSERQREWQQELQNDERERSSLDEQENSAMPLDDDDTIGVP